MNIQNQATRLAVYNAILAQKKTHCDVDVVQDVLGRLNFHEILALSSNKDILDITIHREAFKRAISRAKRLAKNTEKINHLIASQAPAAMVRIFGVGEREFTEKRKQLGISGANCNRPRSPSEEETQEILKALKSSSKTSRIDQILAVFDETKCDLPIIWQVIRGEWVN